MLFVLLMVFAVSCNKPDEPNNGGNNDNDVRVTTYTPQDITVTTAKCGGDVIVTQGLSLTELGVCWGMEENPTADQLHLSTTVWDEPFVCTIINLEPNTKYYVRAYALRGLEYYYGEEKEFATSDDIYNGHEYVDLGLPSGLLWATCNIGANAPEKYGNYFAWGEVTIKSTYNWNNYRYCNGGHNTLTKYCSNPDYGYNGFTDHLLALLPMDDAATVNWGEGWRTPTDDEWQELNINTSHTWTSQNGVYGRLFIGSNGNSLFFPAAGYSSDIVNETNSSGYYWSSSRSLSHDDRAAGCVFDSINQSLGIGGLLRQRGLAIRPVYSEN